MALCFLICCAGNCPTVCVSRVWAEQGLGWESGKSSRPEKGLKNAHGPTRHLYVMLAGSYSKNPLWSKNEIKTWKALDTI